LETFERQIMIVFEYPAPFYGPNALLTVLPKLGVIFLAHEDIKSGEKTYMKTVHCESVNTLLTTAFDCGEGFNFRFGYSANHGKLVLRLSNDPLLMYIDVSSEDYLWDEFVVKLVKVQRRVKLLRWLAEKNRPDLRPILEFQHSDIANLLSSDILIKINAFYVEIC